MSCGISTIRESMFFKICEECETFPLFYIILRSLKIKELRFEKKIQMIAVKMSTTR